ncbi:DMAP1-binding domain-containing protein [Candidatus Pelagibacter sp.]|jgi:hypothetical protein|nr:DMAP1-binding domain-containing protein [Candidatus Pelagibacter sp.]
MRLLKMVQFSKVISIFTFFIFLSGCSSGTKVVNSNKIKPGMSKDKVNLVLYVNAMMDQITIPQSYREYFSSEKKEILGDDKGKVYYVFKNVYTPVKCGILLCTAGDGILEKTFFSYSDARKFVKGQEIIKIEPKTTVSIENNGQINEVETADIDKLQTLIKDFESGKITEEEFNNKKSEIIK